jgi:hypothetical protein
VNGRRANGISVLVVEGLGGADLAGDLPECFEPEIGVPAHALYPGAMQWSASTEREVRGYEVRLSEQLEQIERLHRQRDRLAPKLLDLDAQPELKVGAFMDFSVIVCATCGRDFKAQVGPELLVAGNPERVVCWPCGFEIAPQLAADVLAQRADFAERDALNFLSLAIKWLSNHVTGLGAGDRSAYFEERCQVLRDELRRVKEDRYADPNTWLPSASAAA